jgi:hypothetical protein
VRSFPLDLSDRYKKLWIANAEFSPQTQLNIVPIIYHLFRDISDTCRAKVLLLTNLAERILDWKKSKYKWYNHFLKALNSSSRVREIISQHHSSQLRKIRDTTKLGDLRQRYPKHQEILWTLCGSEKWMWLAAIANQISRDPGYVNRCLSYTYVNHRAQKNQ